MNRYSLNDMNSNTTISERKNKINEKMKDTGAVGQRSGEIKQDKEDQKYKNSSSKENVNVYPSLEVLIQSEKDNGKNYKLTKFMKYLENLHCDENLKFIMISDLFIRDTTNKVSGVSSAVNSNSGSNISGMNTTTSNAFNGQNASTSRNSTKQHTIHRRKSSVEQHTPSYKLPGLSNSSSTSNSTSSTSSTSSSNAAGPIKSFSNSVRSGSFKLRRGSDTALWTSNFPNTSFTKTSGKNSDKGSPHSNTNSPRSATAPGESKLSKLSTSLFKITHSSNSPRSATSDTSKSSGLGNSANKTPTFSSSAGTASSANISSNNSTPITTSSNASTPVNKYGTTRVSSRESKSTAASSSAGHTSSTKSVLKQNANSVKFWNEECYSKYISNNSPHQCNLPEEIRVKFDKCYENGIVPQKQLIEEAKTHIYKTLHNLYQEYCIYASEQQDHLEEDSDNAMTSTTSNDSNALVSTSGSDYSLTDEEASDKESYGGSLEEIDVANSDADSGSYVSHAYSSTSSSGQDSKHPQQDQSELDRKEMFMFVNPMLNNTKDYSTSTCPSSRELTPNLTPNITPSLTPQHSLVEEPISTHATLMSVPEIPDLSTVIDLSKIKDPASLSKTAPFLFQNLKREKKLHGGKASSNQTLSKKLSLLSTTTSRSSTSTTTSERTITAVKNIASAAQTTNSSSNNNNNNNNSNNSNNKNNGTHHAQNYETPNANSINIVLNSRLQTPQMSMSSSSASSFYSV